MIVSNLQNSARVESLHPLFKQLFDYVKGNNEIVKQKLIVSILLRDFLVSILGVLLWVLNLTISPLYL